MQQTATRVLVAGTLLGAVLILAAVKFLSGPEVGGAGPDRDDAPVAAREPMPPAPLAPEVVEETAAAPTADSDEASRLEPPPRAPPPQGLPSFHLRGCLTGLAEEIPWVTPVFVVASWDETAVTYDRQEFRWKEPVKPGASGEDFARALLDWDPVLDAMPRFDAMPGGRPPSSTVTRAGRFDIDLHELSNGPWPARIGVVANDPGYMPVQVMIPLLHRPDGDSALPEVVIPVTPAALLCGDVDAEDRGPTSSQRALAGVAALFATAGGEPTGEALDFVSLDAHDRYQLRAPQSGSFMVVIATRRHRPGFERADAALGHPSEVPCIRLRRGATIDGQVVLGEEFKRRQRRRLPPIAVYAAAEVAGGRFLELPGERLLWHGGKLLAAEPNALLEATPVGGTAFHFEGLDEGWLYQLELGAPRAWSSSTRDASVVEVRAPASDVKLPLHGAYVGVDVSCEFRPVARANVSIAGSSGDLLTTDRDGRTGAFVEPGRSCEVLVTAEGKKAARGVVEAGPPGSQVRVHVVMERDLPGAELAATIDIDTLQAVQFVRLRFLPVRGTMAGAFVRDVVAKEGLFRLDGIPPGLWSVSVDRAYGFPASVNDAAATGLRALLGSQLLPHARELAFDDDATLEPTFRLQEGPKLRIHATTWEGAGLSARCRIFDANETEVPVTFVTWSSQALDWFQPEEWSWDPDTSPASRRRNDLLFGTEASDVEPALPPGRYTVELACKGYATKRVAITLEAGEKTEVKQPLDRIEPLTER